ncbi:MAG: MFS transporter [Chloroflexi bacterium]|nr:MFS transporter [Chloroflexota bacterium]
MRFGSTSRLLVSLYIPSALVGLGSGMAVPVTPMLATEFGVPLGLAAQLVTARLAGAALFLIPAGVAVDRWGRRRAMLAGSILMAVGAFGTALAPLFALLLAAQFVSGVGGSLWSLGREVAAMDVTRADQRGRVMSGFFGISSAGMTLGPVLGGIISDQLGFRAVFVVYFALVLAVLPIASTITETGARHSGDRPRATFGLGLSYIRDIAPEYRLTFGILFLATFAAMARGTVLNSMLPLFVGTQLSYSGTEVGLLFSIIGVVNLAMIGPAGVISDKHGRKWVTVPAAALSAMTFIAYPLSPTFGWLMAISVLVGIAEGFALGSMTTAAYDIIPPHARGQLQALRRGTGQIGSLFGPVGAGVIATLASPGIAFLWFAPLHLVAALLLAFVSKETLPRRTRV